jgi:hypothetical protein
LLQRYKTQSISEYAYTIAPWRFDDNTIIKNLIFEVFDMQLVVFKNTFKVASFLESKFQYI